MHLLCQEARDVAAACLRSLVADRRCNPSALLASLTVKTMTAAEI